MEATILKSVLSYLIEVRGPYVYVQVCEKHGENLNKQMKVEHEFFYARAGVEDQKEKERC